MYSARWRVVVAAASAVGLVGSSVAASAAQWRGRAILVATSTARALMFFAVGGDGTDAAVGRMRWAEVFLWVGTTGAPMAFAADAAAERMRWAEVFLWVGTAACAAAAVASVGAALVVERASARPGGPRQRLVALHLPPYGQQSMRMVVRRQ